MRDVFDDLRYAARLLVKNYAFTIGAVLTLALGIGANSAIFSVVNAVLLRPFPYANPDRVVVVWETQLQRNLPKMFAAPPNFADWREQNQVFEEMAAFDPRPFFLKQDGEPAQIKGARVTASLFSVLKVAPMLGRVFSEEEDQPGKGQVVELGYRLWRDRLNSDPNVIGRQITLNDQSYTVIGVMPQEFSFPPPVHFKGGLRDERADLWIPFDMDMKAGQRGAHFIRVIARLKDGVDLERADADIKTIARRLEQDNPATSTGWSTTLVPLGQQVSGEIRPTLLALLAAVCFVLLIACVNIANLLLAKGAARQKEFAIRLALGAGRGRLIRQLLTESLLLALLGCAAGLTLAYWGINILLKLAPANLPRISETSIDGRVVIFTVAISLLTGLLFGLAPALQSFSLDLNRWMKEGGRSSSQASPHARLRGALVVVQVAMSLVLLVGAGLLFQSFLRMAGVDAGFRPESVFTMRVTLPQSGFAERDDRVAAYREMEQRINNLPAVESAGFINDLPLSGDRQGTSFWIEGKTQPPPGEEYQTHFTFSTPGYFRAMGMPLLRGRDFNEQDGKDSRAVVIINATLARRYFGDEDPVGKSIFVGFNSQAPREIVGVLADERNNNLKDDPRPNVYVPYFQTVWSNSMYLVVRSSVAPSILSPSLRGQIRAVAPTSPIYDEKTMEQVFSDALAQPRFSAVILIVFSATALLLASAGIYAFVSFLTAQRVQEIAIRMALGAQASDILKLVLSRGLLLATMGVAAGTAAALVLTRLIGSLLFGISPTDPITFASIAAIVMAVVMAACYFPARRATKVDPMVALRSE